MRFLLFLCVLFAATTANAQSYRYFDNRGNRFAIQESQYGTVIMDQYGYRGYVVPYYRPQWQPPMIVQPHYGVWQTPNPWYNTWGYGW